MTTKQFQYLSEYRHAIALNKKDYPFYALIMAAMMQADSENAMRLKYLFPVVWQELEELYNTRLQECT